MRVLLVIVPDETDKVGFGLFKLPNKLGSLLSNPLNITMAGDAGWTHNQILFFLTNFRSVAFVLLVERPFASDQIILSIPQLDKKGDSTRRKRLVRNSTNS